MAAITAAYLLGPLNAGPVFSAIGAAEASQRDRAGSRAVA
jgi:hypothetical protein